MVIDLRTDPLPELETYDLCIAGAGAAGISIAREFNGSDYRVALVESGGFGQEQETQQLYSGSADGDIPGSDGYLLSSRLRYFGGTTNHWGGWCRPLDALDFEEREWLPNSGWPLSKQDLEPYYRRAEELVEINSFAELDRHQYDWSDDRPEERGIRAPYFQVSPPTRFGEKYRADIVESENVDLFLHANLTNLRLGTSGNRVERAVITALNGKEAEIRAQSTVLACGGIENPRILLNCRDDRPGGLGNEEGLVGKYFMEHPHYLVGGICLVWDPIGPSRYIGRWTEFRRHSRDDVPSFRVFALGEKIKRQKGLLNMSVQLHRMLELDTGQLGEEERNYAAAMNALSEKTYAEKSILDAVSGLSVTDRPHLLTCFVRGEQAPSERNAVSLTGETDELGMQKTELTSSVSVQELENYRKTLSILGRTLGLMKEGRFKIELDEESRVVGGSHHMGTTRISNAPGNGVVDENCKVHSLDNLYIAGSSVFPTVGFANPTLTLLALSVRLADHLKEVLDDE